MTARRSADDRESAALDIRNHDQVVDSSGTKTERQSAVRPPDAAVRHLTPAAFVFCPEYWQRGFGSSGASGSGATRMRCKAQRQRCG